MDDMSGVDFMAIMMSELLKYKRHSKVIFQYYIMPFISMAASSDFSKLNYEDRVWSGFPLIFKILFLDDVFWKQALDVRMGAFVYYTCLQKIYMTNDRLSGEEAFRKMWEVLILFVLRHNAIKSSVYLCPDPILPTEVRHDITETMATLIMRHKKLRLA